jgi:aryl-alcohol dehydrogenase-like predicted oxidoreductase
MELALGTVQFGLAYGVARRGAPVPEPEAREILQLAFERGVRLLDTAAAYGNIEGRLADLCGDLPFSIVSKLPAAPAHLDEAAGEQWVVASANSSLENLGSRLTTLMFHSAETLAGAGGARLWTAMSAWADQHGVRLGVSCYRPEECQQLLQRFDMAVVQLPCNGLDQRLRHSALLQGDGPRVHLRSAFLQGLLLMPLDQAVARVPAAEPALRRWHAWLATRGWTPLRGALSVVKGIGRIEACVVGVDGIGHMQDILDTWERAVAIDAAELACDLPEVVDPRLWSTQR